MQQHQKFILSVIDEITEDFKWQPGEQNMSEYEYISPFSYGINKELKRKSKEMINPKEFPYQVFTKDFKTLSEAEAYAKKQAAEEHEDVVIKQRISVVKFPLPDLKVESLVSPA